MLNMFLHNYCELRTAAWERDNEGELEPKLRGMWVTHRSGGRAAMDTKG